MSDNPENARSVKIFATSETGTEMRSQPRSVHQPSHFLKWESYERDVNEVPEWEEEVTTWDL